MFNQRAELYVDGKYVTTDYIDIITIRYGEALLTGHAARMAVLDCGVWPGGDPLK